MHGPDTPRAPAQAQHSLDHVEPEAVSTRWRVICACGWTSEFRARTFLWTHYTAHLGLDLEDREGRLAVMYAVAAGIAEAEVTVPWTSSSMVDGLNYPVFACAEGDDRAVR